MGPLQDRRSETCAFRAYTLTECTYVPLAAQRGGKEAGREMPMAVSEWMRWGGERNIARGKKKSDCVYSTISADRVERGD